MPTQNNPVKRLLFTFLGLAISVIPPAVATFSYFPLWIAREDASILSGISLILIAAALVPLFSYVKQFLRTPSAPIMWFIFFLVFFLLSKIADEVTVISFIGFISNLIGSLLFKLAKRYARQDSEI